MSPRSHTDYIHEHTYPCFRSCFVETNIYACAECCIISFCVESSQGALRVGWLPENFFAAWNSKIFCRWFVPFMPGPEEDEVRCSLRDVFSWLLTITLDAGFTISPRMNCVFPCTNAKMIKHRRRRTWNIDCRSNGNERYCFLSTATRTNENERWWVWCCHGILPLEIPAPIDFTDLFPRRQRKIYRSKEIYSDLIKLFVVGTRVRFGSNECGRFDSHRKRCALEVVCSLLVVLMFFSWRRSVTLGIKYYNFTLKKVLFDTKKSFNQQNSF